MKFFIKIINFIKDKCLLIFNFIKRYMYIVVMGIPFMVIDLVLRYTGSQRIDFVNLYFLAPNVFTLFWIMLFIYIILNIKSKIGKKLYLIILIVSDFIYLLNMVYYGMTNSFFDFTLLESASYGAPYIMDSIVNTNIWVYVLFVFLIGGGILGYSVIPYRDKNNYEVLGFGVIAFLLIHSLIPTLLGKQNKELTWNTWNNPRNVYINYNDSNKSMMISGVYEYTVRNFGMTYFRKKSESETEQNFLREVFLDRRDKEVNKYTGKMSGKNVIFLQLEGIDSFLVDKNIMPNLYNLVNNGINFTKHYSYYNGGGSTFNSEFAVNTGYITPITYNQNAYTFNKNLFNYSLANIFKGEGYVVNAFHMNSSEYYSRGINYANFGYDNYYSLKDLGIYDNYEFELDTELILNEEFSDLMMPSDKLFVDYIITYSNHLPFSSSKGVCNKLLKKIYTDDDIPTLSEEECIYMQAKETDDMIGLLIDKLGDKGLLEDTVIVGYADHYLYTVSDKDILKKHNKQVDNNLVNNTPWFIYNKNLGKKKVYEVTSQLNILPTVLNLFDKLDNPDLYIGEDALGDNYHGITFFSDYSWYDGNAYVENLKVINNGKISDDELEEKNNYIEYLIKKNDLVLKYNYFKVLKDNTDSKKNDSNDVNPKWEA